MFSKDARSRIYYIRGCNVGFYSMHAIKLRLPDMEYRLRFPLVDAIKCSAKQ